MKPITKEQALNFAKNIYWLLETGAKSGIIPTIKDYFGDDAVIEEPSWQTYDSECDEDVYVGGKQ